MKLLIITVLPLCCFTLVVSLSKSCSGSMDCASDECCLLLIAGATRSCHKRMEEGDFCYPGPLIGPTKDVYVGYCSCAAGLTCQSSQVMTKNLVTMYVDSTCVRM